MRAFVRELIENVFAYSIIAVMLYVVASFNVVQDHECVIFDKIVVSDTSLLCDVMS